MSPPGGSDPARAKVQDISSKVVTQRSYAVPFPSSRLALGMST